MQMILNEHRRSSAGVLNLDRFRWAPTHVYTNMNMAVEKKQEILSQQRRSNAGVLNLDRFRWAPTQEALKSIACVNIFIMAVDNANDSQSTLALQRRGPEPRSFQMGSHPRPHEHEHGR